MKEETIKKSTGKTLDEWTAVIKKRFPKGAAHREIAAYLHADQGLSSWWSQEVTVQYERAAGLRVLGETKASGFQLGASKTIAASSDRLWEFITSEDGMELITGERRTAEGEDDRLRQGKRQAEEGGNSVSGPATYRITTLSPGSHMRMQWKLPGWENFSILQVRVTEKGPEKSTLTLHHEKLADKTTRENMVPYWKKKLGSIKKILEG